MGICEWGAALSGYEPGCLKPPPPVPWGALAILEWQGITETTEFWAPVEETPEAVSGGE